MKKVCHHKHKQKLNFISRNNNMHVKSTFITLVMSVFAPFGRHQNNIAMMGSAISNELRLKQADGDSSQFIRIIIPPL
ncbi:MAG: hypothetical protein ACHQF0_03595 [Chitinophagales bacterium]